ncbi:MAG TPA: site-specific integrase [Gaiellaceae bacterium]|nr:site-specific integrase [Gaiellaceae bacterium]
MAKDDRKLERTRWPGIYKRGDRYVVVSRDGRGKQTKRFAPTLAAARALQAETRAAVARGEYRQLSKELFTDYLVKWAAAYGGSTSKGKPKPQTLKDYRAAVERPEVREVFRGLRLPEVERQHLKEYANVLEAKGLSARTVRNLVLPLRLALREAAHDRHININPADGLRLSPAMGERKGKRSPAEVRPLDHDELTRLLTATAKLPPMHRLLAEFLLQTGCRVGEALALTWGDLILDRPPTIPLSKDEWQPHVSITKRVYKGTNDKPKSATSTRTVPLAPAMVERLRKHRHSATHAEPVFVNGRGRSLDYYEARRQFKAAAEEAGLPWVGFHTLRHTCATILFRSRDRGGLGANAVQVQKWLGHHKPSFTLDAYVHLLEDDHPDASGFDALLASRGNSGATRASKKTRNGRARRAA